MKSKLIRLIALATIAGSSGALNAAVFNASPLRKSDATSFPGDSAGVSSLTPGSFTAVSGGRPGEGTDVMKKSSSKKSSSKSSSKKSSSKAS